MKLISMKDFVLEQHSKYLANAANNLHSTEPDFMFVNSMFRYANFLNQPLTLGMFVACNLEGNILQEPDVKEAKLNMGEKLLSIYTKEYQQAKERVLFEGVLDFMGFDSQPNSRFWTLDGTQIFNSDNEMNHIYLQFSTIEEMAREFNPTLTTTAQKQIGL